MSSEKPEANEESQSVTLRQRISVKLRIESCGSLCMSVNVPVPACEPVWVDPVPVAPSVPRYP